MHPIALVASAFTVLAADACGSAETLPPPVHTINVGIAFMAGTFSADSTADNDPCSPAPPWDAITSGKAEAVATNPDGSVLGRGVISAPYLLGAGQECRAVVEIPVADAPGYVIDFAGAMTETFMRDNLAAGQWYTFVVVE